MIHFNRPLITGGQVPSLEFTKESIRFNFGNIYFTFNEDKLSFIENMWGEATSLKDYSYLDISITANIHPLELEILQRKFLAQESFEFTWNRDIDYREKINHLSTEARIAKMEVLPSPEDVVKVKIRVIATNIKISYPPLSTKIQAYYHNIDRCLQSSKIEFVLRTYYVCIALHKKTNITDKELVAVSRQFIDLGLFKSVEHKIIDDKLIIQMDNRKFCFKY